MAQTFAASATRRQSRKRLAEKPLDEVLSKPFVRRVVVAVSLTLIASVAWCGYSMFIGK
jgi:CMP-2-keto-3-deoxyoctulosonic acid synthetase